MPIYICHTPPSFEVLVAADVLYNRTLAAQLGRRCHEALSWEGRERGEGRPQLSGLIVTDSQQFHSGDDDDFIKEINRQPRGRLVHDDIDWTQGRVAFTGSGILLDEDQSYEAETRFVSWWRG